MTHKKYFVAERHKCTTKPDLLEGFNDPLYAKNHRNTLANAYPHKEFIILKVIDNNAKDVNEEWNSTFFNK